MLINVAHALLVFEMICWFNPLKIPSEIRLHSFWYRQMDVVSIKCKCSSKHNALGVHKLRKKYDWCSKALAFANKPAQAFASQAPHTPTELQQSLASNSSFCKQAISNTIRVHSSVHTEFIQIMVTVPNVVVLTMTSTTICIYSFHSNIFCFIIRLFWFK